MCVGFCSVENCPSPKGPDYDFGQGPALFSATIGGQARDLLGAGQKSGVYWALDRDTGTVVWQTEVGPGSVLGEVSLIDQSLSARMGVHPTNGDGFGPESKAVKGRTAPNAKQSDGGPKDTLANVRAVPEFTASIVSTPLAQLVQAYRGLLGRLTAGSGLLAFERRESVVDALEIGLDGVHLDLSLLKLVREHLALLIELSLDVVESFHRALHH